MFTLQNGFMLPLFPCSSSPQHIEECCGWLRGKLNDLNKEQHHIMQQHQEQVRLNEDVVNCI